MQFVKFRGWLASMHAATALGLVTYEEVRRHLGTDAAHSYGGFWATLTAFCQEHRIPFAGVPVATIKRHATGKGNASKQQMISAAQHRGWSDKIDLSDDEADALALLQYARAELVPRVTL